MPRISLSTSGPFTKTENALRKLSKGDPYRVVDRYAREGVEALAKATPVDSKLTATSWDYKIVRSGKSLSIEWFNTHLTKDGTPVAILLQYGHGTGTGGYVRGRDFINPAIRPVFDKIAENVWKAVTSA